MRMLLVESLKAVNRLDARISQTVSASLYYAMGDTNPADIKDLQIQAANYISSGEGQTLFQGVVAALKASTQTPPARSGLV